MSLGPGSRWIASSIIQNHSPVVVCWPKGRRDRAQIGLVNGRNGRPEFVDFHVLRRIILGLRTEADRLERQLNRAIAIRLDSMGVSKK